MKYINEFFEGCRVNGIYLCKHRQSAVTKNGKPYENVILQDKTGTIDGKIWDPNSQGIEDFDSLDYIEIVGDVNSFAGALQISIKRVRKAQEYFASGRGLKVARTFIDSGGHYTKYVYAYCRKNYYKQRFAIKGASKPGEPLIAKISKIQVDNHSIPLVLLGTDSGKQYIMDRLSIEVPGAKYMHFPLDKAGSDKTDGDLVTEILRNRGYDRIYFRGLISEELVPRKHNGVIVMRWENIAKDRRNEPLDLAVYNLACLQSIKPNFEALEQLLKTVNETAKNAPSPGKKKATKKRYGCIKRGER